MCVMPLVPEFHCRQLTPETGTGYWYQKTGQCVWPFKPAYNILAQQLPQLTAGDFLELVSMPTVPVLMLLEALTAVVLLLLYSY